jgi:hypothetical protein
MCRSIDCLDNPGLGVQKPETLFPALSNSPMPYALCLIACPYRILGDTKSVQVPSTSTRPKALFFGHCKVVLFEHGGGGAPEL